MAPTDWRQLEKDEMYSAHPSPPPCPPSLNKGQIRDWQGLTGVILRNLFSELDTVMNHEPKDVLESRFEHVQATCSVLNV